MTTQYSSFQLTILSLILVKFIWALALRGIPIVMLLVIFNMEGTEPKRKTVQYLHHQIFSHHFIFDLLVHMIIDEYTFA